MTKGTKILLISFFVSLPLWLGINVFQKNLEHFLTAQISQPLEGMVLQEIIPKEPQRPKLEIAAKSALVVESKKNGREIVHFQKNPNEILPIASLTKLMTAVIVLEDDNYDLENTVVAISEKAAAKENVPYCGNLKTGKVYNVKTLLELMLVCSSNDAAFALSEVVGEEKFIEKMNQKARELEMANTHFKNPTGLDPEPEGLTFNSDTMEQFNYSTAKNLLKLSKFIIKKYPFIFETSLNGAQLPTKNGISDLILLENKEILGGKTGYTYTAGGTMLFIFQDEKENIFFNIILGTDSPEGRKEEMQRIVHWLTVGF